MFGPSATAVSQRLSVTGGNTTVIVVDRSNSSVNLASDVKLALMGQVQADRPP